ncbi:Error-prone repair protein ImuA [Mucilaginibacter pallidiroseus]|uniref:Error-prone repair protein ImuA n=1 Tax=Mucilaginibacter pallidiroseus TaxID=2599295 RepID=A0A563U0R2_9SPHI|nr:Error-prone repair protein ImuA [Mucilaginibacter pallidiroseus]TWR25217.1 Error-prone repair protein ImuA [Mucilaginibacter pallidiroseus]
MQSTRKEIINQLQKEILLLQGFKPPAPDNSGGLGLGPVEQAFPNGVFPTGAIHEFLGFEQEHSAAFGGFIAGILGKLMLQGSVCLWISMSRTVFPPALKSFGIEPDRVIFIDVKRERDILWATEEALKCDALSAVVAEVADMNFMQSRRLQLAVEQSKVTGFILRTDARKLTANICVARWQITPQPSVLEDGMPGVGFPRWNVELLKVRNGNPGAWVMQWADAGFTTITPEIEQVVQHQRILKVV